MPATMETSPNTTLRESASTVQIFNDVQICRLRSGLNVSCLIKVFEYLDLSDLLVLLKMDLFYKEIILKWIIKKKMIKLPRIRPNNNFLFERKDHTELIDIFKALGKSIRKLNVDVSSLQFLLELIMQYCEPAKLTDFYLRITGTCNDYSHTNLHQLHVDTILMDQSIRFFSNLCTLELTMDCTDEVDEKIMDVFITKLLISATNLKTLRVFRLNKQHGWLKYVRNLYELDYCTEAESHVNDLVDSLKVNPGLKKCRVTYEKYDSNNDIRIFGEALSKSCPDLEYFNDYQSLSPYIEFHSIINRYNFLSTMTNLNSVGLTSFTSSCCDLYYPLKCLANANITNLQISIQVTTHLKLSENVIADIMQRELPEFNSLRTLSIIGISNKYPNCRFIFRFLKNLKNLKICNALGVVNVHKILQHAPSINTLAYVSFLDTAGNIVKTLRAIRRSNNQQHLLNLILPHYIKEYDEYFPNDTKNILKISYKKPNVDDWHN